MKVKMNMLILLFALVLIIAFSLSSTAVIPYSSTKLNMYNYEGFGGYPFESSDTDLTDSQSSMESGTISKKGKKVEGFEGLQGTAYAGPSAPLDYFSTLPSGGKCEFGPYSNSQGYICMDENAKRLLSTRGGNAQGSM